MRNTGVFIVALVLFASCKKEKNLDSVKTEPTEFEEDSCNFDTSGKPTIGIIYSKDTNWMFPVFNPNNPDEFAYVKETANRKSKLFIYNLVTQNVHEIPTTSGPRAGLEWSKSGWLTFQAHDLNVWKVKEDGSGLSIVPLVAPPLWSSTGDTLVVAGRRSAKWICYLSDINGKIFDSIPIGFTDSIHLRLRPVVTGNCSGDKLLFNSVDTLTEDIFVCYLNLTTKQSHVISKLAHSNYLISYIRWHPDGQQVLFPRGGLTALQTSGGILEGITTHCPKRGSIRAFSISSDGKKIITSLSKFKKSELLQWYVIGLIDLNSGTDTELQLP